MLYCVLWCVLVDRYGSGQAVVIKGLPVSEAHGPLALGTHVGH